MSIKRILTKSFVRNLMLSLAFLPLGLEAGMYFYETEQLTKITRTHVYADDLIYKLSPTVKVFLKFLSVIHSDLYLQPAIPYLRALHLGLNRPRHPANPRVMYFNEEHWEVAPCDTEPGFW